MKKLFRFTAVAAVAFTLCMALPSCDLINGGDDDDQEHGGGNNDDDENEDAVSREPWYDFGGAWEAYEWYAEDDAELDDYEVELMKEQACLLDIRPLVYKAEYGYYVRGEFNANLLWRISYDSPNAPASDNGTRSTVDDLEIEHQSGWFEIEEMDENYIEKHGDSYKIKRGEWLTVYVAYPMQDGTDGLGRVWKIKFDADDSELAIFRFGGTYHNARMRRIYKY